MDECVQYRVTGPTAPFDLERDESAYDRRRCLPRKLSQGQSLREVVAEGQRRWLEMKG